MAHLLEVRDLITRFYTDEGVVYAVNGISYTLDEGEALAIVGESGSGKSVGVMSMIGLIPTPPGKIEGGEVIFRGTDLLKLNKSEMRKVRGKDISIIFQDPMTSLNPVLTVGRQLTEALQLHLGLTKEQATNRAVEMLGLVGVPNADDRLDNYPHEFSGGQRQRIMIAMSLSCNPALLIADEPTTALDVTIQAQIVELVKKLQAEFKMAIIWITHDLGVIAGMVDKIAVMYGGTIVELSDVRDLYRNTSHPYTQGLLESLPALDDINKRLIPIEGSPPNLKAELASCPFAPRCRYVTEKCEQELPPLRAVSPNHFSACWYSDEMRDGTIKVTRESIGEAE